MNIENGEQQPLTKGSARVQIEAIRAQINTMGANDSEFSSIDTIIIKLEDGEITPEEAVTLTQGVMDSKQDYH
ncbi:MAG: hypothetical protein ACI92I_000966 [Acidimicrobiales bacterium]|jgi:hypothetical protein